LVLVNTNGTVVNANSIALEAFEAPGTALVGRGLLDLLPEFDSRLIPGSMRRPDTATDERGRTKPTRMTARRTDGSEFPVEVTSANLADGVRDAVDPYSSGTGLGSGNGYSGSELLMLVVRDLSGTLDTEAELARSQRQTEMILRAASEGVVGTDTDGRIVLVNPAAAQILGFRASDLGGKELHELVLHSRADGEPFPYAESPLADTLRSGRKHRVRGQVLWSKGGDQVPVDMTTAPVRDGDQLVGAVMTFTDRRPVDKLVDEHAAELTRRDEAAETARTEHAAELSRVREELGSELLSVREELTGKLDGVRDGLTAELAETREQHAEEIAAERERGAAFAEREKDRYEALAARHAQLLAVLDQSLRGPLEELRRELGQLAADDAGQLWPEANQVLHHLSAGYSRMTTLVDNVLAYQLLDTDDEKLARTPAMLDAVVAAGVDGAVELIGPGRVQFAVHAPPIEAEVDAARLATALAHLIADVAGIDATGNARVPAAAGYVDSTVVVAAAQRGDTVRIEVRGPYAGGDPVHEPIVRGIVRAHGGVLQTHEVPGMSGSSYVLEVPIGGGAGAVPVTPDSAPESVDEAPAPSTSASTSASPGESTAAQPTTRSARRRARRASGPSVDAFLESGLPEPAPAAAGSGGGGGTGRRRGRRAAEEADGTGSGTASADSTGSTGSTGSTDVAAAVDAAGTVDAPVSPGAADSEGGSAELSEVPAAGTGRRRARPAGDTGGAASGEPDAGSATAAGFESGAGAGAGDAGSDSGSDSGSGSGSGGVVVPPQGVPAGTGRRARRAAAPEQAALPALPSGAAENVNAGAAALEPAGAGAQPSGRRARRALGTAPQAAAAQEAATTGPREVFALPPAEADRVPTPATATAPAPAVPGLAEPEVAGRDDSGLIDAGVADAGQGAPAPVPAQPGTAMALPAAAEADADADGEGTDGAGTQPVVDQAPQQHASPVHDAAQDHTPPQPHPAARAAQPLPAEAAPQPPAGETNSTQGRAFSVRTLGQGVPFGRQIADQQRRAQAPAAPAPAAPAPAASAPLPDGHSQGGGSTGGSGRRRKLSTRQEQPEATGTETPPQGTPAPAQPPAQAAAPASAPAAARPQPPRLSPNASEGAGRSYAIGAPDQNAAEGPEPLDGPGGAIEIANRPQPLPMDDELPPEPLDNPRRLLVWPAPDVTTQQALSERGYRPVTVHSREEVDAQIAAFPAALFVDPLTGPITRTALQSLRQAAVAAEVPVLVTAGLGQATREAAYGADPAVLLKALAPRDSEQHPPRVLLIEEHEEIALALTATLERRGMQVARATSDADAVTLAGQMRPNLVVMDLLQVRRRRAGIIDWLRANGQLNRTPLVVYTASVDPDDLPLLAAGETVLFLAERSTTDEVQGRIVDLLAKIGTN
jgi:PAS domain S-box-containing protein